MRAPSDKSAWLTLVLARGLGPTLIGRMLQQFKTATEACRATPTYLAAIDGIGRAKAASIATALKHSRDAAEREIDRCDHQGVELLCLDDAEYPAMLRDIPDPPPVLWCDGHLEPRDLNGMAIVGSRRPSQYGKDQAERFGMLLAGGGFTVMSGGAYGVDTRAHRGALRATGGRTIAVLGSGVDVPYPPENEQLLEQIADGRGAVLSEHPLGTNPRRENFPRRNRIISGLSRGVVVIEAAERSGALITARQAADDHNRPVFALPGRVDNPMSAGPHELLKAGAFLLQTIDDVTQNLGPLPARVYEVAEVDPEPDGQLFDAPPPPKATPTLTGPQLEIVKALDAGPAGADELVDRTGLPAAQVQATLTMLSLKGFVAREGSNYVRKR